MQQHAGTGGRVSEPALDVRLDGQPLGASSVNLTIDTRARRTYTILADGSAVTDGRNRVYQAALSVNAPGSPTRVTLGRQISGNLASVGLFDGVLAELNQPDWSTGVFTGSQPEPLGLGFSSSVLELGGYAQRHSRPGAASHWTVTLGRPAPIRLRTPTANSPSRRAPISAGASRPSSRRRSITTVRGSSCPE